MNKKIRTQIINMTVVFALLLVLGIWQLDFVLNAISANIFLNMTIFGTFAFGVVIAYINLFSLKNEILAFDALREDYEDATRYAAQEASDPYWRYYRCEDEAVIFSKPQIIEQPFQIISEEIARTGTLTLSTGVMQNLMDSVYERIDEKKSLVQYVTGILVFLGLIGTFVGLMVTLGSVGDIIGGLDLSGSGGTAAIQGLMTDLQIPLKGMATGFSSSLFGLITSLSLGLMARFANMGSSIFRMSFETWLAGIAKMDSEGGQSASAGSSAAQERELSLMLRVARLSLISNTKLATSMEAVCDTNNKILNAQINGEKANAVLTGAVQTLVKTQTNSNLALTDMANILESREELSSMIDTLRADSEKQTQTYMLVNEAIEDVVDRQAELHKQAKENEKNFVLRDELVKIVDNVDKRIIGEFSNLQNTVEGVGGILSEIDNSLGREAAEFQTQQEQIIEQARVMHDELSVVIENSKISIQKADADREEKVLQEEKNAADIQKLKGDLSLVELQKRLYENFGKAKEDSLEAEKQPAIEAPEATQKKRKGFSLFRRSA